MMHSLTNGPSAHPLVPAQAKEGGPISTLPAGNLYGEPTVLPADLRALIEVVGRSKRAEIRETASSPVAADDVESDDIILPTALYSTTPEEPPAAMPFREELRAAGIGLVAGLFFMVPAVL